MPLPEQTCQSLLISQAVCKLGSSDWSFVSDLLSEAGPSGPDPTFTPEFCSNAFAGLVRAEEYDLATTVDSDSLVAKKLAHKFYTLRLEEIAAELEEKCEEEVIRAMYAEKRDGHPSSQVPEESRQSTSTATSSSAGFWDSPRRGPGPSPPPTKRRRVGSAIQNERERGEDGESVMGDETIDLVEGEAKGEGDAGPSSGKDKGKRTPVSSKGVEKLHTRDEREIEPTPPRKKRVKSEVQTEQEAKAEKDAKATARFKRGIANLFTTLTNEKGANLFLNPVPRKNVEKYYDAVHRPLCITDLRRRVKNGTNTTSSEVMRDAALMFANAVQFNGRDTPVGAIAVTLLAEFESLMQLHVMSETAML